MMPSIYERMQALYQLSNWLSGERRVEDMRQLYVRRRRAWLWRPMLAVGAALLTTQIVAGHPIPLLVLFGIGLCLPWVCDV